MDTLNYLLPHLLLKSVFENPNKIALHIDDQRYTYQLLYEDIKRLLEYMKMLELKRGDRVIIQAGNSYMSIVAFWAVLLCDAVPCIIDVDLTGSALKEVIQNICPKINVGYFITDDQFEIYTSTGIHFINELCERILTPCAFDYCTLQSTEADLAMMMHTSGSTGEPKGVMLSHRNVLAAIQSIKTYLNLSRLDTIFSVLPLHFDYGLYQMLLTIALGATLVLEKNALFVNIVAHKISRYQVTVLPCVPSLIQLLYTSAENYTYDFSSLRIVTNTGEYLSGSHIDKLKTLFPTAQIYSMYGLTECKRCSYVPPSMLAIKSDSIGIPMPNLEMWVQDENGNKVDPYVEGDLVISGPTVMLGYWKNNEATAQKIKIHPSGKRLLVTGDRAQVDEDGYFYFKGRNDHIIKYKGAKFNSHEYVKKLNSLSHINRAHLFVHEQSDIKKLIVCAEVGNEHNHDKIRMSIVSQFPKTQQPDFVYLLSQFPSLSNGKINKHKLEKKATDQICLHRAVPSDSERV